VDVAYAVNYPLMKPYSSLYPKSKNRKPDDSEDAEDTGEEAKNTAEVDGPKGDVEMWKAVEKAMEEGTLNELRYSKESVPAEPPKKTQKPKVKAKKEIAGKDMSGKDAYAAREAAEESDGGFFE
jgi:hypothetical protein